MFITFSGRLSLAYIDYLLAARFFMCLALVGGVAAWVISIVGLLQHRARWLLIAAISYGVQGMFEWSTAVFLESTQSTAFPSNVELCTCTRVVFIRILTQTWLLC